MYADELSMEENEPRSDDEVFAEIAPPFHAITIFYNEGETAPRVDLGDVPPTIAITVFQQIIRALFTVINGPTIKFNGDVIYTEDYFDDFDDDEDEDEDYI